MAQQSKGFQDPTYTGRGAWNFNVTPGASGQSAPKFVAHANLLLMSLQTAAVTLGTSTYTYNGTATISAQQINLLIITNTATSGVALATTTVGPFGVGVATGTATGTTQALTAQQTALNTTAGTAGQGGIPVPAGSLLYVQSGTDATGQFSGTIDYQLAPGAPVTI